MGEPLRQIDTWVQAGKLSAEAAKNIKSWLTEPAFSDFVEDIESLIDGATTDELEDAFRTRIEFGTGGIRGKMGPGPNRINRRTIGEAAQGLAQYVLKSGIPKAPRRGAVIAYDTRNNSDVFARQTAAIFAGNGIVARLFESPRSTPELSFALRHTNAVTGVVISASHNPPSDNGFKAYWTDGGQVVPPHDKNVIAEVKAVSALTPIDYDQGILKGLIQPIGIDIDVAYHKALASLSLLPPRDLRIAYTPLHGVGATNIVPALKKLGYKNLHIVAAQNTPDGNFPTLPSGVANPEEPSALTLAISEAKKTDADIVLASDPDADRLGCALPHPAKGWNAPPAELALNGNQIGAILCHYIIAAHKQRNTLPAKGVVCKTIVTTDLVSLIAQQFGVRAIGDLLVGFKYIADVIQNLAPDETFLFGTEESHGYLAGTFVRDKDAAIAAVLLSECAAQCKTKGRTLRDYLDAIYRQFGYFCEVQKSTYREGAQGNREIAQIMAGLRTNPPSRIGGRDVVSVIDRQTGLARNLKTGTEHTIDGPKGNVLIFTFTEAGHTRVTARPSGTEPKIKYYVSATSADHPGLASGDLQQTKASVDQLAAQIITGMLEAANGMLT